MTMNSKAHMSSLLHWRHKKHNKHYGLQKIPSFNTISFTSFNNVYTSVVNKYRTIYWVLMTIPRALDFVYFIGGGVITLLFGNTIHESEWVFVENATFLVYAKDNFYRSWKSGGELCSI